MKGYLSEKIEYPRGGDSNTVFHGGGEQINASDETDLVSSFAHWYSGIRTRTASPD
jgi:hypothetical protein